MRSFPSINVPLPPKLWFGWSEKMWRRREKSKTKSSSADSVSAQIRAILEEVKMDFRLWLMRAAG